MRNVKSVRGYKLQGRALIKESTRRKKRGRRTSEGKKEGRKKEEKEGREGVERSYMVHGTPV